MLFPLKMALYFLLLVGLSLPAKAAFKIAKMDSPDHIVITRIIRIAYQRLHIPVEFVEFPGRRSLYEANSGAVDAELSRIFDVGLEFHSLRRVPTPIFWFNATAFSKNKDFKVFGWESLRSLSIGIMRGMVFSEKGVKGFPKVTVVDKPLNLFKMLESGRIDVVVFSGLNGLYIIKDQKLTDIHALQPAIERIYAYHYVHKKHEDLVPKLDAVFQEMKKSGEMERIRQDFIQEFLQ